MVVMEEGEGQKVEDGNIKRRVLNIGLLGIVCFLTAYAIWLVPKVIPILFLATSGLLIFIAIFMLPKVISMKNWIKWIIWVVDFILLLIFSLWIYLIVGQELLGY